MMIGAFFANALAKANFCCSPPENTSPFSSNSLVKVASIPPVMFFTLEFNPLIDKESYIIFASTSLPQEILSNILRANIL